MAMTTTPLGFKKPDGNELARNGENVIADNAQVAQDLHASARARLAVVESAAFASGALAIIEDPSDPGTFISAGPGGLTEDPADPGTYLIGA